METILEKIRSKAREVATEEINDTMETVITRVDPIRAGYFEAGAAWMHEELTWWRVQLAGIPNSIPDMLRK